MCLDNKSIGSLRCACCNIELQEHEFVFCDECDEKSTIEDDIEKLIKEFSKEYTV